MIPQTKFDIFVQKIETIGNSLSFYMLLLIVGMGVWILTPFAPDWRPDGKTFGFLAILLVSLAMLHGILWFLLTRESLKFPKKFRAGLASTVRVLRPFHMMAGMLALGIVLIHGFAFLKTGYGMNGEAVTGIVAVILLAVLAIDGIGLMASPFLSRIVHRWMAVVFVAALAAHLWMVL